MRFFLSKTLMFGVRAGVLFDPVRMNTAPHQRAIRPGSTLANLGQGVSGIYVITGAHNMCKIGISSDPEFRLAALQTGSHVRLKLHYVLAVKTIDPRQIEALAHKMLDKYRCAGEWFDCTPQMAEDAVNEAAAHYGIKSVQTTSNGLASIPSARHHFWQSSDFKVFMAIFVLMCVAAYYLANTFPPETYN